MSFMGSLFTVASFSGSCWRELGVAVNLKLPGRQIVVFEMGNFLFPS